MDSLFDKFRFVLAALFLCMKTGLFELFYVRQINQLSQRASVGKAELLNGDRFGMDLPQYKPLSRHVSVGSHELIDTKAIEICLLDFQEHFHTSQRQSSLYLSEEGNGSCALLHVWPAYCRKY